MNATAAMLFLIIDIATGSISIALGGAMLRSHGRAIRWMAGYALRTDDEKRRIDAAQLTAFVGRTGIYAGGALIVSGLALSAVRSAWAAMIPWALFAAVLVVRIARTRWERFRIDR